MVAPQGYFGSGDGPQVRCCQTTERPSKSNVAVWVSGMLAFAPGSIRMPPDEEILLGQPRPSIQRTMSSMWTHMSPTIPLLYSVNDRQRRGCTSSLYGRMGAGPVHIS